MRCNCTDIRGFRNATNVLWSFLELIEYREVFGGMFDARQARMQIDKNGRFAKLFDLPGMLIKSMFREKEVPK
jgi:hypothetical protein